MLLVLYYNQPPTAPDERQAEMESRFINIMIIKEERQHICPKITRGPAQVGAWLRDVMKSPFAKTNTGPSWWDEEDPNGQQIEIKQILYTYVEHLFHCRLLRFIHRVTVQLILTYTVRAAAKEEATLPFWRHMDVCMKGETMVCPMANKINR